MISNSSWMLADSFIRMFVGLVLGTLIARYLGPSGYGSLRYAIAFVSVFSVFATLGLDGVVVSALSVRPAERWEILGSAFVLNLAGGRLAYGLVLASIASKAPHSNSTNGRARVR